MSRIKKTLNDDLIRRDMHDLAVDVVKLFQAKYPRLLAGIQELSEEQLIEFMIELCDIFDLYKDTVTEVAAIYHEHRTVSGPIEDRHWPEN